MRQPISPKTNPERFTEHETELYHAGKCGYQTAYGLPWDEYCEEPLDPTADYGYCPEHSGRRIH